jgi:hypothetical protein
MDGKIEHRVCIKFCVKLGKSATETLEMLREAFGQRFLNGIHASRSVEDNDCSGRPSTCKTREYVGKIRELIHDDRRRTIRALADTVVICYGVCQQISTENLNMRRIAPLLRELTRPHVPEIHRVCD